MYMFNEMHATIPASAKSLKNVCFFLFAIDWPKNVCFFFKVVYTESNYYRKNSQRGRKSPANRKAGLVCRILEGKYLF